MRTITRSAKTDVRNKDRNQDELYLKVSSIRYSQMVSLVNRGYTEGPT
jgi:hypothetical protein